MMENFHSIKSKLVIKILTVFNQKIGGNNSCQKDYKTQIKKMKQEINIFKLLNLNWLSYLKNWMINNDMKFNKNKFNYKIDKRYLFYLYLLNDILLLIFVRK